MINRPKLNIINESFNHIKALFSPKINEYRVANINTGFAIDVDKPIELEDFDWDGEHKVISWDSLDEVTSTRLIEYIELLEYLRQKFVKYHEIGYYETLEKLFPFGAYKGKLIEKRNDYRFDN